MSLCSTFGVLFEELYPQSMSKAEETCSGQEASGMMIFLASQRHGNSIYMRGAPRAGCLDPILWS